MITAGIDCGAKNTKTVIVRDGAILAAESVPTGFDPAKAAHDSLGGALQAAGIYRDAVYLVAATGSGKDAAKISGKSVSDIRAMAKAARFFYPGSRTVADVGAEEGRAARIDEKGEPVDFAVNDKCAAGAGAFIEAMARALEVTLEEMGPLCLQSNRQIPLNAQCVIFAESEVVGLIHAQADKPDISRAIHDAIAGRVVSLIRRIGSTGDVVLIGGVGRNCGFVTAMRRQLQADHLYVPDKPEFGAAVGAAMVAAEKA
ncbi:MAG: CoA activase [Deltaproteobacteria bacterium SG8_13]|nr:MAG: CoA activase [Deltaproteobacteria bacterium SG8_13]